MSMTDYASMSTTTERAVLKTVRKRSTFRRILQIVAMLIVGGTLTVVAVVLLQAFTAPVVNNAQTAVLDISVNEPTDSVENVVLKNSLTDTLVTYKPKEGGHVLDPTLIVAKDGLEFIQSNVQDYTATLVKQERVGTKLLQTEYATCKIRRAHEKDGKQIPFSVYLKFLKPRSVAGREVIYVDGQDQGRLIAHEGGFLNRLTVHLEPTSFLAMQNNRYPITEIGIETLVKRMIEKGERDREYGDCKIDINRNVDFEGSSATMITITHEIMQEPFDFHIAKIYINDETNLPLGYEGYDWPIEAGGEPRLMERYFYRNMKVNVGLTDEDFDPRNKDYEYPSLGL